MYLAETLKLPKDFEIYVKDDLEVVNPAYKQRKQNGLPTEGIKRKLKFYKETKNYIEVPRQYRNKVIPEIDIKDVSLWNNPRDHLEFNRGMTLRENQAKALEVIMDSNGNRIIEMPTGSGKTVTGIAAICHYKRRSLVIVNKTTHMHQWKEEVERFSNAKVGLLGDGKKEIGEQYDIVLATYQSLHPRHKKAHKQLIENDFFNSFDIVVVDECHHASAETVYEALSKFPARIRLGFTATAYRADGLDFVFKTTIGEVYQIEMEQEIKPNIWECRTKWEDRTHGFYNVKNRQANLARLITKMTQDESRNKILHACLKTLAKNDRRVLFLTARVDHARKMYSRLKKAYPKKELALLIGSSKDEERQKAKDADFVFATYGVAKEGLDLPLLDSLVFATPIAGRAGVIQAIGRLTREKDGKKGADVYDFVDNVKVFANYYGIRRGIYIDMGLDIRLLNLKKMKWVW